MKRREVIKLVGILSLISFEFIGKWLHLKDDNNSRPEFVFLNQTKNFLPELFVIGDSISIHYGTYLEKYLYELVKYDRKRSEIIEGIKFGQNGGDSNQVLDYLRLKFDKKSFTPDYMLLNCGLHDIKRRAPNFELQVSPKKYNDNLNEIFEIVKRKEVIPIWIRTTPVVDSIHNARVDSFKRYASDLQTYNKIADEICTQKKITIIDLFHFTQHLGKDQYIDNVHFNEKSRAMQAAYIAGFIQSFINSK